MLTRLKISGFKNLVDVDVRFGPFTCIAGANGVGKSNLFDAIRFLSLLAERPLLEAASAIRTENARSEAGRFSDIRRLFYCVGEKFAEEMRFEAEMIIAKKGEDELGQTAKASSTFLRYELVLGYNAEAQNTTRGALEVRHEALHHILVGDAVQNLGFPHKPEWRKSVIEGNRRGFGFISTTEDGVQVRRHQDGGHGRPLNIVAKGLKRTVLSSANAAESPTTWLARREMQAWRILQLEPTALREPDSFDAPSQMSADGLHLPATLYRLANTLPEKEQVYFIVAARLFDLIGDVRELSIDRDEKRELQTLILTDMRRTTFPARALSDGSLRFLALAVMQLDPQSAGVICLEEPENGIHPARIPAMIQLLRDIACDTEQPVDETYNPLRQVIVNTHSPRIVLGLNKGDLLLARTINSKEEKRVAIGCLPETWRAKFPDADRVALGHFLPYLEAPETESDSREATVNQMSMGQELELVCLR